MIPTMVHAAPKGFAAAYKRVAKDMASPAQLRSILLLVGYDAEEAAIAKWPAAKRVQLEVYCVNQHLRASDNPIRRHPHPAWLPQPWKGPEVADMLTICSSPTVL